jgi:TRAP-type C4-dicarboxylate transport system substrate-binding protein
LSSSEEVTMHDRHPTIARILATAATSAATMAGNLLAQDVPPLELRYATAAPQNSAGGIQVERWSAAVDEESRGSVKLAVFFGGQLGADAEIVRKVAHGRLDMGGVSAAFASQLVPELQLLALPMFFRSAEELDCVLDSDVTATVTARLAARGVHLLGWGGTGTIGLVGKRAFTQPADLAGTKAGTYGSPLGALLWQALKANAAPTSSAELASGFQTGLIDVALAPMTYYAASGLNKVAPVFSHAGMIFMPAMHIMNQTAWDRLSGPQRAALERASLRVSSEAMRPLLQQVEATMRESHLKGGGQLVELSAPQRAALRSVIAPVWPQMVDLAGSEGRSFFALMSSRRQACEAKR